jgi:hypothetical protein
LMYRNRECFVIGRGYNVALPASSKFNLTKPVLPLAPKESPRITQFSIERMWCIALELLC